jgi:hypothetical protein
MALFDVSRQARRRLAIADDLPTEHPALLDEIEQLMTALPDPAHLCAEERAGSLAVAARLRDRLDAFLTDVAGEADGQDDSRVLHAGTPGTLVAVATKQTPQTGSAMVARGRALRSLPYVRRSFKAGEISGAHVAVITAEAPRITRFATVELHVVTIARQVDPAELRRLLKLLADQCQPEGPDAEHEALHDKRGVSLSETLNGMFRLDGYLDPVAGARLRDALAGLMERTDRRDTRTAKQRRADALAALTAAALANTSPLGVSQLSVLVDLEELAGGQDVHLADGSVLGERMADLLTCAAIVSVILGVRRAGVFVPLALGRGRRRASAAQWTALVARDRGCIRCGKAPRFCEAHHIVHWRHGGFTDVSNLALLCSRCHHDLHFGAYTVTVDQGVPRITTVTGRAPPKAA